MSPRASLLVVNQYFPPDRAATGMLLGQLCADLAPGFDVTVVCGSPTYNPEDAAPPAGVRVQRVPLLPLGRTNPAARLCNYALFTLGALARGLAARPRVVMAWSDPPWISWIARAVARARGAKLVLVTQDVYPDIAFAAKGRPPPPLAAALARFFAAPWRGADRVVAIGEDMKRVLVGKGVRAERIDVIENWQDEDRVRPADGRAFRDAHGIGPDEFVVMHSGNMGHSQDLDLLLDAAARLGGEAGIRFVLVGDGARRAHLGARAHRENLANVAFLPYQDSARLSESLGAGDLHYVSLLPAYAGLIVPSKIYGILAAGRPVLSTLPPECGLAGLVRETGCGIACVPEAAALAEAIRGARTRRDELPGMGRRARAVFEEIGTRRRAVGRYARLIQGLAQAPG